MSTEHTTQIRSDINRFEGMRAPLDQRRCQQKISPGETLQSELPEVDTAWEGQQSTGEGF